MHTSPTYSPKGRATDDTASSHCRSDRLDREQSGRASRVQGLGGPRHRSQAAGRHLRRSAPRGRPAGTGDPADRARRHGPDSRIPHHLGPPSDRGGEHRREWRPGAQRARRPRPVHEPPARSPRHRPEALRGDAHDPRHGERPTRGGHSLACAGARRGRTGFQRGHRHRVHLVGRVIPWRVARQQRPPLPSWIRSANGRPRPRYFLATDTTSRRLASTSS